MPRQQKQNPFSLALKLCELASLQRIWKPHYWTDVHFPSINYEHTVRLFTWDNVNVKHGQHCKPRPSSHRTRKQIRVQILHSYPWILFVKSEHSFATIYPISCVVLSARCTASSVNRVEGVCPNKALKTHCFVPEAQLFPTKRPPTLALWTAACCTVFDHCMTSLGIIFSKNCSTYLSVSSFSSTRPAIFSQSSSSLLSVFCIVWLMVFSTSLQTSSIWFTHRLGCQKKADILVVFLQADHNVFCKADHNGLLLHAFSKLANKCTCTSKTK